MHMSEATAPVSAATVSTLMGLESALLDRVAAAVMAIDLQGTVLFANRYVEQLFEWTSEELVGGSSAAFAGISVSAEIQAEIFHALQARQSWEGTFEVRRKDGTMITVRA